MLSTTTTPATAHHTHQARPAMHAVAIAPARTDDEPSSAMAVMLGFAAYAGAMAAGIATLGVIATFMH